MAKPRVNSLHLPACAAAVLLVFAGCLTDDKTRSKSRSLFGPDEHLLMADVDGDGFTTPDDCLDDGFTWATNAPNCSEQTPLRYKPVDGANAKDFTVAEYNGYTHMFHIRGFGPWGFDDNETDFGHVRTTDYVTWETLPNMTPLGVAGDFNDRNVWAPHLVRRSNGRFYMYYTGVTYTDDRAFNRQRIGLTRSWDLSAWSDVNLYCDGVTGRGCVLDCDAPWTSWDSGDPYTGDCRDPFVMEYNGAWIMFLTTRLTDGQGVIARATSGNGRNWTLLDPVPGTEGLVAESPTVTLYNGLYYLFFTANTGLKYATGTDPFGAFTVQGSVNQDFANEILDLSNGTATLFPYVDDFEIAFTRLLWNGSVPELSNVASPICMVPASAINPGSDDPPNGLDDNCDGYIDSVGKPPTPGPERPIPADVGMESFRYP